MSVEKHLEGLRSAARSLYTCHEYAGQVTLKIHETCLSAVEAEIGRLRSALEEARDIVYLRLKVVRGCGVAGEDCIKCLEPLEAALPPSGKGDTGITCPDCGSGKVEIKILGCQDCGWGCGPEDTNCTCGKCPECVCSYCGVAFTDPPKPGCPCPEAHDPPPCGKCGGKGYTWELDLRTLDDRIPFSRHNKTPCPKCKGTGKGGGE